MMFRYRYIVLILAICLIGFLLSLKGKLSPIKNFTLEILSPFSVGFERAIFESKDFFQAISQIRKIEQENKKLSNENLELLSRLSHLADIERENQFLKEELGFAKKENLKLAPAQIISRSPFSFSGVLTINKGENDGLSDGAATLSSGFLIGQVVKTFKTTCQVLTIMDSTSKIPVLLAHSRGSGLLKGGLEGLIIEDIPLDIKIEKDEDVLTSPLGGQLPSGLPVGKVVEVLPSKGAIFQKVKVSSPISFSRLEVVFVVKK